MTNKPRLASRVMALLILPAVTLSLSLVQAAPSAQTGNAFADPAFQQVWARTDQLVQNGTAPRTWFWGPGPDSPGLIEANAESPGGVRLVQYFDKSRMEINNPQADRSQPFFVTNGLLTVELISGRMQVGESTYVDRYPACIPATGDAGDQTAPTYSALQKVSNTTLGDHPASDMTGQVITATIDRLGNVGSDPAKSVYTSTQDAYFDTVTKHNIPSVFWQFLNSQGPVLVNGQTQTQQLSNPWFYASGRPISEAYWTRATIDGKATDVLLQMYERRALTYVPTYTAAWQVEMANIGQHYYDWRYRGAGQCAGVQQPTVEPTFAASPTAVVTGTAVVTTTAGPTDTPGSHGTPPATESVTAVPGTPMPTGTAGATDTPVVKETDTPTSCEICTAVPTPSPVSCEICTPEASPTP